MKEFYEIEIGGITRRLPLCKLNEELNIGAFVIFGDVEDTGEVTVGDAEEGEYTFPPCFT